MCRQNLAGAISITQAASACAYMCSISWLDSWFIAYGTLTVSVVTIVTRCSAIAERQRCRVRYSFRQKKSRRLELGDNILRTLLLYLQPLSYNRPENLSNSVKKRKIRAITAFKVIQGHRGRYQSKARMRFPISD